MGDTTIFITVIAAFVAGVLVGLFMTIEIPEPAPCPVPDHSAFVCGYVIREHPNHAGQYIRGTGCAPYRSVE